MKTRLNRFFVATLVATLSQIAYAIPQLRISDGTSTLTITDNSGGDNSAIAGRIVWDGSIGNWTFNTHVGTTYPALGSALNPMLDLSFNAVSNGAGGTLTLSFTQNGFGPTAGNALAQIGGTTNGTVTYQSYGVTNNAPFNMGNLLSAQGPYSSAFSGEMVGGSLTNNGPYSLTQVVTINHTGSGITTGNANLFAVPDSGLTVLLLGCALSALGALTRFRNRFGGAIA
jgi:hypothetical protein